MSLSDIEYIEAILRASGTTHRFVESHVKKALADSLKGFATQQDVQALRDKDKELEKEIAVLAERIDSVKSRSQMIMWVTGFLAALVFLLLAKFFIPLN